LPLGLNKGPKINGIGQIARWLNLSTNSKEETWRESYLKAPRYRGDALATKVTTGSKTPYKFITWDRITTPHLHDLHRDRKETTNYLHRETVVEEKTATIMGCPCRGRWRLLENKSLYLREYILHLYHLFNYHLPYLFTRTPLLLLIQLICFYLTKKNYSKYFMVKTLVSLSFVEHILNILSCIFLIVPVIK
jgi:hypothetical protein